MKKPSSYYSSVKAYFYTCPYFDLENCIFFKKKEKNFCLSLIKEMSLFNSWLKSSYSFNHIQIFLTWVCGVPVCDYVRCVHTLPSRGVHTICPMLFLFNTEKYAALLSVWGEPPPPLELKLRFCYWYIETLQFLNLLLMSVFPQFSCISLASSLSSFCPWCPLELLNTRTPTPPAIPRFPWLYM